MISCVYDEFRKCFWLQDTNKAPTALLQPPQDLSKEWIQVSPEVMILLSDCFRLTIYEFYDPEEPARTKGKIEEGVFKVFEALRKNPKGLSLDALHSLNANLQFEIKAKWDDHLKVRFADRQPFTPGSADAWLVALLKDYKEKVSPVPKKQIACENLQEVFAEKRRKDRNIVKLVHSPLLSEHSVDFVKEQYYVPAERAISDYVKCVPAVLNLNQQQHSPFFLQQQEKRHEALRMQCPKDPEEFKAGDKRLRRDGDLVDNASLQEKLQHFMCKAEQSSNLNRFNMLTN